jgi:hypothetical protein
MSRRLGRRWCVMLVVGTVAAAGCGGDDDESAEPSKTAAKTPTKTATQETPKLKLAKLERNLPEFLNSGRIDVGTPGGGSTPSHAEVTKASCPKEVEKKSGTTFRCTVKGSGGVRGHIDITLTHPEGESFTYEAEISGGPFGKFSGKVG